ncbi:hypothetical protein CVT24_001735 [Panaeolus cyanescens]|uniref:Uncharacterized protein n=1 Tax=Panaeolus cyanescens TaxID=181874 RepID=A0A409YFQ8_9AGAR|nr:hypothetical protein CVT24_001735 [Panaeolus cyanescens]
MSSQTSSASGSTRRMCPLPNADHHVVDLRHYQRVSPTDPEHRDFIVATIQAADDPKKISFLRLERSRQGTPHLIRNLPQLYKTNPLASCLLRDFLAHNIPRVHDEAKVVFEYVMLALTMEEDTPVHSAPCAIHPDGPVPRGMFGKLTTSPEEEGADTVTTMKCHPLPEEATLIQVAKRSSEYPLSVVLLACSASAAHLFDPVYRLFKQQSFWFVKVFMGVFLADGHVSIVQNQLPVRLVEDEVDYGEVDSPKLVKCAVEDLLLDTIHEIRFCRDQMLNGMVVEYKGAQEERERARTLRKKLNDAETWIQEYRLKLKDMLEIISPLKIESCE